MRGRVGTIGLLSLLAAFCMEAQAFAQTQTQTPTPRLPPAPTGPAPVEKIGNNLFRLGQIRVDTASREISVPGRVNSDVMTLEFVANSEGGMKAYETALTLDTNAVTFNTALILIGLDKAHAKLPRFHFDTATPQGDPVEVWVECPGGECQRMRAERLMFDRGSNSPMPDGSWVYTGSQFLPDGRYLAELDGVLIGFVHDPATIIEYVAGAGLGRYGSIVVNPNVGIVPGTLIKLTVKAVGPNPGR